MAITFDDLPVHGDKPASVSRLGIANSILATLKREHLPPVYGFLNAAPLHDHPADKSVVEAWRAADQPLANHTYSHPSLEHLTASQFEADILRNEPTLSASMGGEDWHWFRFPYLEEGETLAKRRAVRAWLAAHHYRIAEVSLDFQDYLWNDSYARCSTRHDEASIRRLHDTYLTAADRSLTKFRILSNDVYHHEIPLILLLHLGAFDARMLPELIALYRTRGVTFVTLAEASADPAYDQDPDYAMRGGGALQEMWMDKQDLRYPPESRPARFLDRICR